MSPITRTAVESFWEYIAFALNSLVFLLIGLEVHVGLLLAERRPIFLAFVAVSLGRAFVVFLVAGLLHGTTEAIP
jgi:CPA1 family monovalent cation:H+ antiporter